MHESYKLRKNWCILEFAQLTKLLAHTSHYSVTFLQLPLVTIFLRSDSCLEVKLNFPWVRYSPLLTATAALIKCRLNISSLHQSTQSLLHGTDASNYDTALILHTICRYALMFQEKHCLNLQGVVEMPPAIQRTPSTAPSSHRSTESSYPQRLGD